MKAVCIYVPKNLHSGLTQGKTYEVMETYLYFEPEQTIYKIIDDGGRQRLYGRSWFMPLEEWRDRQISEILKKE